MTQPSIEVFSHKVVCSGSWTLAWTDFLLAEINQIRTPSVAALQIDANAIDTIDTSGAWLLNRLVTHFNLNKIATEIVQLKKNQQHLFTLVSKQTKALPNSFIPLKEFSPVELLGKETVNRITLFFGYLSFIGELTILTMKDLLHPLKISWREVALTIEEAGCYALPIIALLNFLVGIVLAYQMGMELKNYGANIYIVDLLGLSILREFAPLITAIIVAGRTGSAFTAEIGSMIVNEEVDALKTMGVNPTNFLGRPKLFGMIFALPLLTVWGIIFGIFGGMLMANHMLNISFITFITRFHDAIKLSHYIVGLIKTPIFGMIIASVGCFQGFQVARRADSVGKQTTKSVVQAIFLIIIVDALFSILFSWAKI